MQAQARQLLSNLLLPFAALALLSIGAMSQAQTYPTKPIHFLTFNGTGGPADLLARTMAEGLTESLGQPVIVEYRMGAGGAIVAEATANAAPDGYTIGGGGAGPLAVAPALRATPYDPLKSFAHIVRIYDVPLMLVVHSAINVNSVQELVAMAKAQPGKLNYGSYGVGTTPHLGFELFKIKTGGLDMVHVPYKSDIDMVVGFGSGDFQATIFGGGPLVNLRQLGKVKMLATTGATRDPDFPELPTMQEAGFPGIVITGWGSIMAPAGTPREIVVRLNRAIIAYMSKPEVIAKLAHTKLPLKFNTPEEMTAMVARDFAQWKEVKEKAGLKID